MPFKLATHSVLGTITEEEFVDYPDMNSYLKSFLAKFRPDDDPLKSILSSSWKERIAMAEKHYDEEGTFSVYAHLAFNCMSAILKMDKSLPYVDKAQAIVQKLYYKGMKDPIRKEYYTVGILGTVYFQSAYDYLRFRDFLAVNLLSFKGYLKDHGIDVGGAE